MMRLRFFSPTITLQNQACLQVLEHEQNMNMYGQIAGNYHTKQTLWASFLQPLKAGVSSFIAM